jgi:hypothetical protein
MLFYFILFNYIKKYYNKMFSDPNLIPINYYHGTKSDVPERNRPMNDDRRQLSELNLARFMTVRTNCSTACTKANLADLSEEEQNQYIENAKTAQNALKNINNDLSRKFDSCIRGCFGKYFIIIYFILFLI